MRELDSNGYAKSIMPTKDGRCYVCNNETETVRHEILYGIGNRVFSKIHGTWVNVCPRCHNEIHNNPNTGVDMHLKRDAQWNFERSHSREEFVKIFGRNYL